MSVKHSSEIKGFFIYFETDKPIKTTITPEISDNFVKFTIDFDRLLYFSSLKNFTLSYKNEVIQFYEETKNYFGASQIIFEFKSELIKFLTNGAK